MEASQGPDGVHDEAPTVVAPGAPGGGSWTLATAVRRHPILTILPLIVLAAAGVAYGIKKHPTYSAVATINVGRSDINTQATPGYEQASEALAGTYSRLVTSQHIAIPAARALSESPASVAGHLSSVPIPSEPTFTVTATARASQRAVRLVNAAIAALQKFVVMSATQQGGPAQLLKKYERLTSRADTLNLTSSSLQARLNAHAHGVTPAQVVKARVGAQTATLEAEALAGSYANLAQNGVAPQLDVLIDPTAATSTNRTTNIEKYGVIGAVAGLIIGVALAALVTSVATRRRARV